MTTERPAGAAAETAARRAALADICNAAADSVIGRVVEEAGKAMNLMGFGGDAARRYGDAILGTLGLATDAIRETDEKARARKIGGLAAAVRAVSDEHHVPRIIERGLTSIAIRLARQAVRRGAANTPYGPDELEREFVAFSEPLEEALFSG